MTTEFDPMEEFRRNAPLVDPDGLVRMLREDMFSEGLRERAESIWIGGSFVNPDKAVSETSDLDVFVVDPTWELPISSSGIALMASEPPTPSFYDDVIEERTWAPVTDLDKSWQGTADEAWEMLPEYAKKSLIRSNEKALFPTERNRNEGRARPYELGIGSPEQLDQIKKDFFLELWSAD